MEKSKKACLEKIKVKECNPGEFCMGAMGSSYILQCASRKYVRESMEECEAPWCTSVKICHGSLCVPDIFS